MHECVQYVFIFIIVVMNESQYTNAWDSIFVILIWMIVYEVLFLFFIFFFYFDIDI